METVTYDTGILTDESRFTSGKFNQYKFIAVPATYFCRLWNSGVRSEESPLHDYIEDNIVALKDEYKSGRWDL